MPTESQPPESPGKKTSIATVLIPVAVVLVGVLFTLSFLKTKGSGDHGTHSEGGSATGQINRNVGETLPDLELKSLAGESTHLSDLKAKVILINFWATWCGPCVKEMPSLQKLATEYASQGLVVIGINVDENPAEVLSPFLKKHAISFPSFVDPDGSLADRFSISGLPLTLVIDSERKILFEHLGDEEWFDTLYRKQFELWLKGKSS
jgi:thiol-disulfide isomerase/thioredoxin